MRQQYRLVRYRLIPPSCQMDSQVRMHFVQSLVQTARRFDRSERDSRASSMTLILNVDRALVGWYSMVTGEPGIDGWEHDASQQCAGD